MGSDFVALSLPPLLIGLCASMACALPGNFLILRKQALIGDAISHVVLPGIVVAFLFTGQVSTWPMMIGAAGAAITAVLLIELIRRVGRIESGAAMGVIFTSMFAAGVLLLEQSDTSQVHLDVEHALFGNLESLIWLDAEGWASLFQIKALAGLPVELLRMATVLLAVSAFVYIFWRPLALICFDDPYARTRGIATTALGFALVTLTAIAAVAAFDAVGSIIVIAMIICPPATARLMVNSLRSQVIYSQVLAFMATVIGYMFAGYVPLWLGFSNTLSAAGMIASMSGVFLACAALFGPHRRRNI
ncbi:MAG: metal ABC transporter permease [Marinovum sp.]|nr:metal ABC transporter permease [Marinovum sp.]